MSITGIHFHLDFLLQQISGQTDIFHLCQLVHQEIEQKVSHTF